jgi:hypothetical protein
MNRTAATRTFLLALLGAGLIALFVWWWLRTFERVTDTIELPARAEAAYNPLYALKLALKDAGRRIDSRQRLDADDHPLKPEDTVLMFGDPRMLTPEEVERLLAWVERGGHLIVRTPTSGAVLGGDAVPLLEALKIVAMDADPICHGLQVGKLEHHQEFCDGRRFYFSYGEDESVEVAATWGDEEAAEFGYARVIRGEGTVDVLAEMDFLTNEKLEDPQHTALVRQLLQPNWNAGGTFHLIYSAEMPSLFRLLLDYAWRVLLPAALALLLWLWMRTERLGPLLPPPAPDRRSLLEHVQASGDHLYRYGRRAMLYAAVHEAFQRRLRQRDPYLAALDGPAQIEALARRTGWSTVEVEAALRYPRPGDARDFVLRIARLLQLRTRL